MKFRSTGKIQMGSTFDLMIWNHDLAVKLVQLKVAPVNQFSRRIQGEVTYLHKMVSPSETVTKLQNRKRRREMETESGRFLSTQFMRWGQLRHGAMCTYCVLSYAFVFLCVFVCVTLAVCLCSFVFVSWSFFFPPSLWDAVGCDMVQSVSLPLCACVVVPVFVFVFFEVNL